MEVRTTAHASGAQELPALPPEWVSRLRLPRMVIPAALDRQADLVEHQAVEAADTNLRTGTTLDGSRTTLRSPSSDASIQIAIAVPGTIVKAATAAGTACNGVQAKETIPEYEEAEIQGITTGCATADTGGTKAYLALSNGRLCSRAFQWLETF